MKKNTLKKSMAAVVAVMAASVLFFGCNTEDVDPNIPYIETSQTIVTIPMEGGDMTIPITSNRPWTVSVDAATTEWLVVDNKTGSNNGEISFSAGPNSGATREATLHVATSSVYLDIRIVQPGAVAMVVIYADDFGNAGTTASPHVLVADYTGWNKSGTGAANVTYSAEGGGASVRNNASSSGYDGASGNSNVMMAAAGASFLVNTIDPSGMTGMQLSFGANETHTIMKLSFNTGGADWEEVSYEKTTSEWGLVTVTFDIPEGSTALNLKFTASSTTYGTRVDDIKLVGSAGAPSGDLRVSPASLSFAAAGEAKTVNITSTQSWTVTETVDWLSVSPDNGSLNGVVTVTAAANTGAVRTATVTVAAGTETKTVSVTQAAPGSGADAIYYEDMGKTAVGSNTDITAHTGWSKEGSGGSGVTYSGTNASVRTSVASTGYAGASGGNEVFFGASPAAFIAQGITLPGVEGIVVSFGASKVKYDNGNKWDNFADGDLTLSYSSDGNTWTPVSWTLASAPEAGSAVTWALASAEIPAAGISTISLKWDCTFASYIRIDDIKVVPGGAVITNPNPVVSTRDASDIEETTATIGGSYIAGSDAITEVGFEYKTGSGNYTTIPASGIATPFSVNLTGLTGATPYTFRAYAKTANGIFHGDEKGFQTKTSAAAYIWHTDVGSTPVSGNTQIASFSGWETVGTGAANVTYSGANITIRTSSASSYTGASGGNNVFFGALPNSFTVNNINVNGLTSATLTFGCFADNFNAEAFILSYSFDGSSWVPVSYTRNTDKWALASATIPVSGATLHLKWEATTASTYRLDDMSLTSTGTVVPPANPTVTTADASTIDKNTATVGGSYVAGSDAVTEVGVEYKTGSGQYTSQAATGTSSPFSVNLTGLTSNTAYTFKAYAKAGGATIYGTEKTFTTLSDYTLTVSPDALSFAAASEDKTFNIVGNTAWTVISSELSWCTVSPDNGNNNGVVTVTAAANTGAARAATITVSGTGVTDKTIAVTQAGSGTGVNFPKVEWDFATSTAATITSMAATTGQGMLTVSNSSGSFTHATASGGCVYASSWTQGAAWDIEIPVSGFTGGTIKLSFKVYGSATGPRDFAIEWSADKSTWSTGGPTYTITATAAGSADEINEVINPSGLSDKLYIRLRATSNTSINGSNIGGTGTSRLIPKLTIEEQ
ncbi:MAG: BACON domain-containing protein [Prevotellaceae bacterium]|nr:BACON domain-containing protein [Prevotellaceae bacterium]